MNYKVLYRKYRPNNFENIIGQEYIIKTLKNSIINNNISHAYIFSGPRGTGKTSTAKVFAKAINCLNPINGSPCEKCEFCTNFAENPDIIEIDAASNNGVDEIRSLIDNIKLTPSNGKYKVYIIDEVHMLTTSAFNALLLTLEEPPSHAIFILATTNIENVPITILSRCQRFDFQKITVEEIKKALFKICEIENIQVDDDSLYEIAYLSDGGMRDALSLLDQLSKSKEKITIDIVEKQIKTISKKSIEDLLDAVENSEMDKFLNLINEFKNRAVDYKTLVKKIIDGLSVKAKELKKTGRIKKISFSDYKNLIISLSDTLIKTNINVDSYTILEMIFLEYFDNATSKVEQKKDIKFKLNENMPIENNNLKINNLDNNFIKIRINNCFVNAKREYLEQAKIDFTKLINSITIDGKIKAVLLDSQVVAASDKYLIFSSISNHVKENGNNIINEIEKLVKKELNKDLFPIFITNEEWNQEKEEYVKNIRSGKKYEYIEEKNSDSKEELEIVNDIFDKSKIEII